MNEPTNLSCTQHPRTLGAKTRCMKYVANKKKKNASEPCTPNEPEVYVSKLQYTLTDDDGHLEGVDRADALFVVPVVRRLLLL